ncbi:MAG: GNAT family N-acetyltransferase [Clostridia bacterium]|nr:GNAT family N-acetyltransferase [Clostridia bacterium]
MDFISKKFCELSATEVYEILKSRAEIFLLEQGIVCQDLDDVDYDSLHCFFWDGKRVTAYLRAFEPLKDDGVVMVGRVLTLNHRSGMGSELMKRSVEEIKKNFACDKISVHAQKQAVGFYEKMGFHTVSGEFLEEGIVHVTMEMHADETI